MANKAFNDAFDQRIADAVRKDRRRILQALQGFSVGGWTVIKNATAEAIVEDQVPTDGD